MIVPMPSEKEMATALASMNDGAAGQGQQMQEGQQGQFGQQYQQGDVEQGGYQRYPPQQQGY